MAQRQEGKNRLGACNAYVHPDANCHTCTDSFDARICVRVEAGDGAFCFLLGHSSISWSTLAWKRPKQRLANAWPVSKFQVYAGNEARFQMSRPPAPPPFWGKQRAIHPLEQCLEARARGRTQLIQTVGPQSWDAESIFHL